MTGYYQKLQDLFQTLEFEKDEIDPLIKKLLYISLGYFMMKGKTFLNQEEMSDINDIFHKVDENINSRWTKFLNNPKYKSLFLKELDQNIKEMIQVISSSATEEEQKVLQNKIVDIFSLPATDNPAIPPVG